MLVATTSCTAMNSRPISVCLIWLWARYGRN